MMHIISRLRTGAGVASLVTMALVALIWWAGPTIEIGGEQPLASPLARMLLVMLAISIGGFIGYLLHQAGNKRNAELASAAQPGSGGGDAALLKNMERTVKYLKQGKINGKRLRLTEMPWYVLIGPPGNGKTTALRASGLNFPLRDLIGNEQYHGSQGTRNCTWWLSDQAVFLDTAGRYSVPETDGVQEGQEWRSFLKRLKQLRSPVPLNGIILMVGADSLLQTDNRAFRHICDQLSSRISEILDMCGARIPVYLVISKIDRLPGFVQVFGDELGEIVDGPFGITLDPSGQVNPIEEAKLGGQWLIDQIDRLALAKVTSQRNRRVAVNMMTFPRQLQVCAERTHLLLEALARTRSQENLNPWVRGFYFISSIQEGSLIDKLSEKIEQDLGVRLKGDTQAVEPDTRSFFLSGLLRKVVLREPGISGKDALALRRPFWRTAWANLAVVALATFFLAGMTVSFSRNLGLINSGMELTTAAAGEITSAPWNAEDVARDLDALFQLSTRVSAQEPSAGMSYRFFLYQGRGLTKAASDQLRLYGARVLMPALGGALEAEMRSNQTSPGARFEALRCYLMLGSPSSETFNRDFVLANADRVWRSQYGESPALASILRGFERFLDLGPPPLAINSALVEEVRRTLGSSALSALSDMLYQQLLARLSAQMTASDQRTTSLAEILTAEGATIFNSPRIASPIPKWFQPSAPEQARALLPELAASASSNAWVIGGDPGSVSAEGLQRILAQQYADAYVAYWSDLAESTTLNMPGSAAAAESFLTGLSGTTGKGSPLDLAFDGLASALQVKRPQQSETSLLDPVAIIGNRFTDLGAFLTGTGQPSIATLKSQLAEVRAQLSTYNSTISDPTFKGALASSVAVQVAQTIKDKAISVAALPAPISRWFGPPLQAVSEELLVTAAAKQGQAVAQKAEPACTDGYLRAFPFAMHAPVDATLKEVADVFAPTGSVRLHMQTNIKPEVQTSGGRWRLREDSNMVGAVPQSALDQFKAIEDLGDLLFADGSRNVAFDFQMYALRVPSSVRMISLTYGSVAKEIFPGAATVNWRANDQIDTPLILKIEYADGNVEEASYSGTWSLLRMIDALQVEARGDEALRINLPLKEDQALLAIKSRPLEALYRDGSWRKLGCPKIA